MRSTSAVSQLNRKVRLGSITNESSTKDFVSIPGGFGEGGGDGGAGGAGGDGGGGVGGGAWGSAVGGSVGVGVESSGSLSEPVFIIEPIEPIIAELMVMADVMAGIASIARRWAVVATAGDPGSATK